MEWSALGWRDGILLLVALTAIYLVVMLLRLTQVGRRRHEPEAMPPAAEKLDTVSPLRRRSPGPDELQPSEPAGQGAVPSMSATVAVQAYLAEAEEEVAPANQDNFAVPPTPTFEWDEVEELLGEAPAVESPPPPAPRAAGGFGEHIADHLARSDMEMEVQRMRDEMERMRAEMEEIRAARRVSPQYAEAMELVQRGLTAQDVADRLGISLGEAELVHALSRGDKTFDEGDEHGEDGYAAGDRYGHRNAG